MNNIIGVYKITNTITGDLYVGSSKDVKLRWMQHKRPSTWNRCRNPLYKDMKQYGIDNFSFQILAEVEAEKLKEAEQQFIETLNPTYNDRKASGWNIERQKKSHRKASNNYENQLCCYNNEVLTLATLSMRFIKAGIEHPTLEAKKYIIGVTNDQKNINKKYRNHSYNQRITEDDL